jgi:hypothetical protein
MKLLLLFLLLLATRTALGQPVDLGFEDSLISNADGLGHWQAHDDSFLHYRAEVLTGIAVQGNRALQITARESQLAAEVKYPSTGVVSQTFDATPYLGKRIRYSAFARRVAGEGEAELMLLVHRGNEGAYNLNASVDPSSTKWKEYEIIADIRPTATEIVIRIQTKGDCSILFDSVAFEVVNKNVRTEKEEKAYYRVIYFYEGFTEKWVYEGEIRLINGTNLGGTIVMTNGRQYRYNKLSQSVIDRVNRKYRNEK